MATTAPDFTWSYGQVVNYTDSGTTDDTEQWGYGQVLSVLDYEAAAAGWTGKINGVTNPAKICGIAVADISKVCGVG